ncbi:hypothetical protein ACFSVM_15920 [Paenibacillus shunpengii]|uniref:Uncharacterized protein n=1 Tax=Paenibacillus shunpengii TaxID=2054424 RepID=A0ABW5SQA7_9BACL
MNDIDAVISNDSQLLCLEHLYTVDDYLTLSIRVKSGGFSGESNFCISKERINLIIEKLREMQRNLLGSITLDDYDSDANIIFKVSGLGHLVITGQIGGSHAEHMLKFKFVSDQTIINGLIDILNSFLR